MSPSTHTHPLLPRSCRPPISLPSTSRSSTDVEFTALFICCCQTQYSTVHLFRLLLALAPIPSFCRLHACWQSFPCLQCDCLICTAHALFTTDSAVFCLLCRIWSARSRSRSCFCSSSPWTRLGLASSSTLARPSQITAWTVMPSPQVSSLLLLQLPLFL